MISLTWEEFEKQFKPIENDFTKGSERMFETYGIESEFVSHFIDSRQVWTLIDSGSASGIYNGMAWANRLGYYVTEVAWDADADYEVDLCEYEYEDEEEEQ
jgi:hypothetical protein